MIGLLNFNIKFNLIKFKNCDTDRRITLAEVLSQERLNHNIDKFENHKINH